MAQVGFNQPAATNTTLEELLKVLRALGIQLTSAAEPNSRVRSLSLQTTTRFQEYSKKGPRKGR